MDLRLRSKTVGGVAVINVAGEIDIDTSPRLRAAIDRTMSTGHHRVVVDLLRTRYLDSTAVAVLTGARRQARDAGGMLALVYNQPHVEKILAVTRLSRLFPAFRTEAAAVKAARRRTTPTASGS